ncbi:unnamed protein product, partial [Rotaria sp. Silwood1]
MNSGLQVIDIGVRGEYDTGIGASSLSVD